MRKCSICSGNWTDCIHTGYEDVKDAAQYKRLLQVGALLLGAAVAVFIVVIVRVAA